MIGTKKIIWMGFLLGLLMLAAGCSSSPPTVELKTDVPVESEQVTLPATQAPTAMTNADDTGTGPAETEEPGESGLDDMASSEEVSACVGCHTDQAMLMDTADPVEEVESENEGAG